MSTGYPWHESNWGRLTESVAAGRLAHGLLLSGPAGAGPLEFALAASAYLLCDDPADDAACGQCRGCHLAAAGNHPDFLRISPEEPGKPVKINQIRALAGFAALTRNRARHKVVIVYPAEQLNMHAANSLLKTLEEPTPGTVLLLVTHLPGRIPATVRSRCQTLSFGVPDAGQVMAWLGSQKPGAEPAVLAEALALASGLPLKALAFIDDDSAERRRQRFGQWQALVAGADDPVARAKDWYEGNVAETLDWVAGWCEDAIRLKMTGDPGCLRNPDLVAALAPIADRFPIATLYELSDRINTMRLEIATTQLNTRMALETLLADFGSLVERNPGKTG